MGKPYFVYIMSNKSRRLYVGITSEFQVRVFKHQKQVVRRVVYRTLPV